MLNPHRMKIPQFGLLSDSLYSVETAFYPILE